TVILGEVGLGGEVRAVRQVERRLKEAAKLGFGKAVIPAASRKGLKVPRGMRATGVAGVREAMEALFHE
ncbi:MAG TPA: DNA repair protein RadA, partial [bacterium]|nr:DNA repair protein RadA [bacterium]